MESPRALAGYDGGVVGVIFVVGGVYGEMESWTRGGLVGDRDGIGGGSRRKDGHGGKRRTASVRRGVNG